MKRTISDQYQIRLDKIVAKLSTFGLNAFLVTNPANIRYLTGFTGGDSYLLVTKTASTLISDERYSIQIEQECKNINVYICTLGDYPKIVRSIIKSRQHTRLGVEPDSITLLEYNNIAVLNPKTEIVPLKGFVSEFRQIKDKYEIEIIRESIDTAYNAFTDIRNKVAERHHSRSAVLETEIRDSLEYQMRKYGASDKSFPSIVCSGKRAAMAHGVPANYDVLKESMLLVDYGAVVNGYMSDLTRVLILKTKDKKVKEIYDIVLKAQKAAIKAIKPGRKCRHIDKIARDIINDSGYKKNFGHNLGHSIGLEIHENPRLSLYDKSFLQPGMVVTVEPGIYIKDWGGIRIEDDVLVTEKGCEILSKHVPKEFDECVL
ncbi:MAG: Xaa-Pro peptidase family protein [Planctomycetaceae bacterium]|jgi:Xaa-Pro aminopeptidase|nr:Xaa-Pro peptidase family protein [Planctomycetaceae bacterium]